MKEKKVCEKCHKAYAHSTYIKHVRKCLGPKKKLAKTKTCVICKTNISRTNIEKHVTKYHHMDYFEYKKEEEKNDNFIICSSKTGLEEIQGLLSKTVSDNFEREFQENFFRSFLAARKPGILYVHGPVGSGKTTTINKILDEEEKKGLKTFRYNAAKYENPEIFFPQLDNLLEEEKGNVNAVLLDEAGFFSECDDFYDTCLTKSKNIFICIESTESAFLEFLSIAEKNNVKISELLFPPYQPNEILSVFERIGLKKYFCEEALKFIALKICKYYKGDMRTAFSVANKIISDLIPCKMQEFDSFGVIVNRILTDMLFKIDPVKLSEAAKFFDNYLRLGNASINALYAAVGLQKCLIERENQAKNSQKKISDMECDLKKEIEMKKKQTELRKAQRRQKLKLSEIPEYYISVHKNTINFFQENLNKEVIKKFRGEEIISKANDFIVQMGLKDSHNLNDGINELCMRGIIRSVQDGYQKVFEPLLSLEELTQDIHNSSFKVIV